jgi:hypothetical protein
LYFGPAAVTAYRAWGRLKSMRWQKEHGDPPDKPGPDCVALSLTMPTIGTDRVKRTAGMSPAGQRAGLPQ